MEVFDIEWHDGECETSNITSFAAPGDMRDDSDDPGMAPTLYLAYRGEYDEEGILGVFPTMESAIQALRDYGDPGKDGEPPTTEELKKRIVPVRLGEAIR